MKKRSQRRDFRYGKGESGCIWSLVHIFDFRHSRYARKLLSDKKRGSRRAFGPKNSGNKHPVSPAEDANSCFLDDEEYIIDDAGKNSVKKLIEEEMCSEQDKNEMETADIRLKLSDSEQEAHLRMHRKRTNRTQNRSRDLDRVLGMDSTLKESEYSSYQNLKQQFGNGTSIEKLVEEFCCHLHQNNGFVKHEKSGKVHVQSNENLSNFKKKLVEAIEELIIQKFNGGKDPVEYQKLFHSRKLMHALNISSSDEELLHQFMQNLHILLEKCDQKLQNDKAEESKFLDGSNIQQSGNSENPKSSNSIIILKPRLVQCQNSKDDDSHLPSSQEFSKTASKKAPCERVGSHLSLAEMKRKFKHALGKERQKIPSSGTSNRTSYEAQNLRNDEKGVAEENVGRNSPSKEHFYFEIIPRPNRGGKRGDNTSKLKDSETNVERKSNLKKEVSDPYNEARKHLSVMLSKGDDNVEFLNKCIPKISVLSHPEYNFSPTGTPSNEWEHSFITACMRFSGRDEKAMPSGQEDNSSIIASAETQTCVPSGSPDVDVQTVQVHPSIVDELVHEIDIRVGRAFGANKDEMNPRSHEEIGEAIESVDQIEISVLDASSGPSNSCIHGEDQINDTSDIYDDDRHSKCLEQVQFEANQLSSSPATSPSTSSIGRKVAKDLKSVANTPERPSPKSVLDPLLSDDDISPGKAILQHVEPPMQPLQLQFDDNELPDTSYQDKESTLYFVKTVLLSSGMDWVELCLKRLSSEQLLDPSLLGHDEVELFANRSFGSETVHFDCVNEVLMDLCQQHSPWSFPMKRCGKMILDLKEAIHEVGKAVYRHLLRPPYSCTLEQIVEKDMTRTGAWMDLHWITETVSTEVSEGIFEDLMEETILNCVHEGSEDGHIHL